MFKPFPIGDYDQGLYEAREPWLAPRNAWSRLSNGSVWRGRLVKRRGYTQIGTLGDEHSELSFKSNPITTWSGTTANAPIVRGTVVANPGDPTVQLTDATQYRKAAGAAQLQTVTAGEVDEAGNISIQITDTTKLPILPGSFQTTGSNRRVYDDGNGGLLGDVDTSTTALIDYETGFIYWKFTQPVTGELNGLIWQQEDTTSGILSDQAVARPVPSGIAAATSHLNEMMGPNIRYEGVAGGGMTITADWASGTMTATTTTVGASGGVFPIVGDGVGFLNCVSGELDILAWNNITTTVPVCTYTRDAGEVNYTTGAISGEFWAATAADLDLTYQYESGEPVMGLHSWIDTSGSEHFLATSTTGCWRWNSSSLEFDPVTVTFSGTSTDKFWFTDWDDLVVINNGVDAPQKYDGTIAAMGMSGLTNPIQAALFAVRYKGVLIYFGTTELGALEASRARWTSVTDPETFRDDNDFADAATNELPQSAHFIGDTLYVQFERSVWRLVETGNPNDLFYWERVPHEWGSVGRHATVETSEVLFSRTPYGVIGFDGQGQVRADAAIPDVTIPWNADKAGLSEFIRYDTYRQLWLSYADSGEEEPNHVLVLQNQEDGGRSWSTYDLPFNTYGEYLAVGSSQVWDDIQTPWDLYTDTFDMREFQTGHTLLAAGGHDGKVYRFDGTTTDAGAAIEFVATSMRLNPFQNQRTQLGWVDVWLTADANATLEVKLYEDYRQAAYKSAQLSLAASGEKTMVRLLVNHAATWHTIELRSRIAGNLSVDLVVPWFRPVGPVRPIS